MTRRLSLDQIIRIASFRCRLRAFIRHSEQVARRWDLTPQRYLLLLKGRPTEASASQSASSRTASLSR